MLLRRYRSEADIESLVETINIARASGVKVELILAPYSPEYFCMTHLSGSSLAWIQDRTGQMLLNNATQIDDPLLFADPIQSNPSSAEKLARRMSESGDL